MNSDICSSDLIRNCCRICFRCGRINAYPEVTRFGISLVNAHVAGNDSQLARNRRAIRGTPVLAKPGLYVSEPLLSWFTLYAVASHAPQGQDRPVSIEGLLPEPGLLLDCYYPILSVGVSLEDRSAMPTHDHRHGEAAVVSLPAAWTPGVVANRIGTRHRFILGGRKRQGEQAYVREGLESILVDPRVLGLFQYDPTL